MTAKTRTIRPGVGGSFTEPTRPQFTGEVLAALTEAHRFATTHNLPLRTVEVDASHPDMKEWDPSIEWDGVTHGWTLPVQPTISVRLYGDVTGFVRWCVALGADRIEVERNQFHTDLRAHVRGDGVTWKAWAHLSRPMKPHPHLPGINAPWRRENGRATDHGVITPDDLRAVLTRLDVPAGDVAA